MTPSLRLALPLLLAGGLIAGCGRNPGDPMAPAGGSGGGAVDESAEVSQALSSSPELIEDGQFESAEMTQVDGAEPGRFAAINPLYFFRKIESVERRFEFAFADTDSTGRPTTAIVTVHKLLRGTFNIVTGTRVWRHGAIHAGSDRGKRLPTTGALAARQARPAAADRPRDADRLRPRWRIAASRGRDHVAARDHAHPLARDPTATQDTVIEDPLAFFRLRRILKLNPGEEVRLVATTERRRRGGAGARGLRALRNNGDNTRWYGTRRCERACTTWA
jgi:hypothetical protein